MSLLRVKDLSHLDVCQDESVRIVDIAGYEGLYKIDELGNVYSLPRTVKAGKAGSRWLMGGLVATRVNPKGYLVCNLFVGNGKQKTHSIHRLLCLAFKPNPDNKPFVNHIDANKLNNSLENLEWCTCIENNRHARGLGLVVNQRPRSKLTEQDVLEIRSRLTGKWGELSRLSEEFGVSHRQIANIRNYYNWKHIP